MTALVVSLLLLADVESDPLFQEAKKLEAQFEYGRAAALLDRMARDPSLSSSERARVLVEVGVVRATMLDSTGAEQAFTAAVAADPSVEVPVDVSPKVRDLFLAVKSRAPTPALTAPEPAAAPAPSTARSPELATPPSESHALLFVGAGVAAAGTVVALGGAGGWLYGRSLLDEVPQEKFQSDAATLADRSVLAQAVGQGALALGVVAIAAGAGVLVWALLE